VVTKRVGIGTVAGGGNVMARLSYVYDGQVVDNLTRDEIIQAILREYKVDLNENTYRAMEEAFRCGFHRGEEYMTLERGDDCGS